MHHILSESPISLSEAARRLNVNPATIWRWHRSGIRLPNGMRLFLEVVRLGGRLVTSDEAISRFVDAQNPTIEDARALESSPSPIPPSPIVVSQDKKRAVEADRKLIKRGY